LRAIDNARFLTGPLASLDDSTMDRVAVAIKEILDVN
jgi:hypothetical protein